MRVTFACEWWLIRPLLFSAITLIAMVHASQAADDEAREPFQKAETAEAAPPSIELEEGEVIKRMKNMQSLMTALILYAGDYGGHYPQRLDHLVSKYLHEHSANCCCISL